jgi:peptidylprolyl isomerase
LDAVHPADPPFLQRARRARLLLAVVAAALVLAACNGDDGADDAEGSAVTNEAGVQVDGSPQDKPEITVPDQDPPGELVIHDIVEGDGDEASEGASVTTHYVGVSWSTNEQFDASWDRGDPITFPLSGVITGWQEGIPGMRVGGRRLLVIPPDMAYGDNPPPGAAIGPGETLVFVIDLEDVQ